MKFVRHMSLRGLVAALLAAAAPVALAGAPRTSLDNQPDAGGPSQVTKGFSLIYQFPENVQNYSFGGVAIDSLGNLFGATYAGGTNVYGEVYELSPVGGNYTFTDIHEFTGPG